MASRKCSLPRYEEKRIYGLRGLLGEKEALGPLTQGARPDATRLKKGR